MGVKEVVSDLKIILILSIFIIFFLRILLQKNKLMGKINPIE
jgi:hypothetical protein